MYLKVYIKIEKWTTNINQEIYYSEQIRHKLIVINKILKYYRGYNDWNITTNIELQMFEI
jgi:hypothetical protein